MKITLSRYEVEKRNCWKFTNGYLTGIRLYRITWIRDAGFVRNSKSCSTPIDEEKTAFVCRYFWNMEFTLKKRGFLCDVDGRSCYPDSWFHFLRIRDYTDTVLYFREIPEVVYIVRYDRKFLVPRNNSSPRCKKYRYQRSPRSHRHLF